DTTLYAKWSSDVGDNFHIVTFDANGGSDVISQWVKSGGKATRPADPTKMGHKFDGWCANADFTELWDFSTDTVTRDTTLHAKWVAAHTVRFIVDGSPVDSQTVAHGGTVTRPADPTKAGYKLEGWYANAALTLPWDFSAGTVVCDTTLYAKWSSSVGDNFHIVNFDANGGSPVNPQIVEHGGTLTPFPDPTKADVLFEGWFSDKSFTLPWNILADTVTRDMTLYVKWTLNIPSIFINGVEQPVTGDTVRYLLACGEEKVSIYAPNILNDTLYMDSLTFAHDTVIPLIGKQEPRYRLKLVKPFEFDSLVNVVLGGRLMVVINNPANNGGFHFQEALWWCKHEEGWRNESRSFYYASPFGEVIQDTMYVELRDSAGAKFKTCPNNPLVTAEPEPHLAVFPNPVVPGATVHLKEESFVDLNLEERYATLSLFDVQGNLLYTGKVSDLRQGLAMPSLPGIYILSLEGKAGKKHLKIVVEDTAKN
ncbi:MAG: InlB B-repeat-containing protein, partial [Prevotellaceae bacterium]|nr:InlB B-repeat-containing protein [Prevotellaceae bacterium]